MTYVPARNTIFLSLALGLAEATGAREGAARVGEHGGAIGELDAELRVGQDFLHHAFHLEHFFLGHSTSFPAVSGATLSHSRQSSDSARGTGAARRVPPSATHGSHR